MKVLQDGEKIIVNGHVFQIDVPSKKLYTGIEFIVNRSNGDYTNVCFVPVEDNEWEQHVVHSNSCQYNMYPSSGCPCEDQKGDKCYGKFYIVTQLKGYRVYSGKNFL